MLRAAQRVSLALAALVLGAGCHDFDEVLIDPGRDGGGGADAGPTRDGGETRDGPLTDGGPVPDGTPPTDSGGDGGARDAVTQLSLGGGVSCALRASGAVTCWGGNDEGQLGDGTLSGRASPMPVMGVPAAVEVRAGWAHVCARLSTGAVTCWGRANNGQLGDGRSDHPICAMGRSCNTTPVTVMGISDAARIAASSNSICVARRGGSVSCWGSNSVGELGDGTTAARLTPVALGSPTGVTEITAGGGHVCATSATAVYCWGANAFGQLGTGTADSGGCACRTTSVEATAVASPVEVAGGGNSTCARVGSGATWCWGDNRAGQLGDGSFAHTCMGSTAMADCSTAAVEVSGLSDVIEVDLGLFFACARRSTGQVVCWGRNNKGQLGDGTSHGACAMSSGEDCSSTPVEVSGLADAQAIAVGGAHACALRATGAVVCWGSNSGGQLGDGTTTDSNVPVTVVGLD